jgi:hypothetical protein
MKVYIITGETGDYDDWVNWNVVASLDQILANQYRDKLRKFLVDNNIPEETSELCTLDVPDNPDDLQLKEYWQDRGVVYQVKEVELIGIQNE